MTESHTAARIDATDRANNYPDSCSTDTIATALEGRRLRDGRLIQKVDPICRRCKEKNQKRRMAGVDLTDSQLGDGDRVRFHAVHVVDDDGMRPPHWNIRSLNHTHHPQLSFDDCIEQGTSLARACATIHESPSGELYIIDVDVRDRSRADAGPDQSVVDERQQQFIDDSDEHPDGATVINRGSEDAPAGWPDAERDWLSELIESHGPLTAPRSAVLHPGSAGPNPGADWR